MLTVAVLDDNTFSHDFADMILEDVPDVTIRHFYHVDDLALFLEESDRIDVVSLDGDLGLNGGELAGMRAARLLVAHPEVSAIVLHSGKPECVEAQRSAIPDTRLCYDCGYWKWADTLADVVNSLALRTPGAS